MIMDSIVNCLGLSSEKMTRGRYPDCVCIVLMRSENLL
jgi:hypothetical protein